MMTHYQIFVCVSRGRTSLLVTHEIPGRVSRRRDTLPAEVRMIGPWGDLADRLGPEWTIGLRSEDGRQITARYRGIVVGAYAFAGIAAIVIYVDREHEPITEIRREYGRTPAEVLARVGLASPVDPVEWIRGILRTWTSRAGAWQ